MINCHHSYVAKLEFKLATPGSVVRHATICAMETSNAMSELLIL